MELIFKFALEVTVGAVGYLMRKWYGEHLDKYIFIPIKKRLNKWIFSPIAKYLKKHLVTTRREAAIWLHYRNKALNKGHQHKTPIACEDGRCSLL